MMDAKRMKKRSGLKYVIIALIVLTATCLLFAGAAFGESGTVEVSVRVAPTIQFSSDGTVTSNASVRVQMAGGILTVMPL